MLPVLAVCRRWIAATTSALLLASSAVACSNSGSPKPSLTTSATLKSCAEVACTGEIDGAPYRIELPRHWNGTLLLWSHGYRPARPVPPDFQPIRRDAEVAKESKNPLTGEDDHRYADTLLAKGYALAGSGYKTNGWAVADGVRAAEQLHDFFISKVGKPQQTYVWGESMGGLVTETVAERHPDWVRGTLPICGLRRPYRIVRPRT